MQIASISEELAKKTEDAARQQEEITHLLSQIVDLQKKAKAVSSVPLADTERAVLSSSRGLSPLETVPSDFMS